MDKVTFTFPDHDSLWQFKSQTRAVNVAITPKKNMISGLFQQDDVELAVSKFSAVTINSAAISPVINESKKLGRDWFRIDTLSYIDRVRRLKRLLIQSGR